MTVTIHTAADHWRLTPTTDQAMPDLAAPLPLRGGLLAVDVEAPDAPPWVEIHDLDEADAAGWVEELYGADAVTAARRGDPSLPALQPPPDQPLLRLAVARWLHRWWPSADVFGIARLDHDLLRAEIGALTHAASRYLEEDEPVGPWLGPAQWRAAIAAAAADPGPARARRHAYARALRPLVAAAADLDPDIEGIAVLATVDLTAPALAIEPPPVEDLALAAGGLATDPIDWWLVPPRSVSARDDALTWTDEAGTLTVNVAVGDEASDGLLARAYASGEPFPAAICALSLSGDAYRGTAHHLSDSPIERVDVYHPEYARPPAARVAIRHWQHAVRQVATRRTIAARQGPTTQGIAPFLAELLATSP